MGSNEQKIFKTLLYSSIFSFPLTKEELYYYLHTSSYVTNTEFEDALKKLSPLLCSEKGYMMLLDDKRHLKKRLRTEHEVSKKIHIAKQMVSILSFIPSIYFIGISGGVAVGDASQSDDIDLFIITKKGTLYTTRLLLLGVLQLFGKRRKRSMKKAGDKICLNMLIDEDAMKMSEDYYTAHEIVQMYPLFERKNSYKRFLRKNSWISNMMHHAKGGRKVIYQKGRQHSLDKSMLFLESFARFIQSVLIKRHRTIETVETHLLAFHPKDYKQSVLHEYFLLLEQNEKTIDSIK